jgi:iron complex outermembrane receptor protein
VPKLTLSAGGEYDHSITLGAREVTGYLGLDYTYRSTLFSNATDSIYSKLPGLSLLNVRGGVRSQDGKWDFYLWAKNVTNVYYATFISAGVGNTGALDAGLGDPRTYGVTLRFHY